jgi:hypothetical protein
MDHDVLRGATPDEQRQSLAATLRYAGLTLEQLWIHYFALGGDAALLEVDAFMNGAMTLPSMQRDVLAQAVNEHLDDGTRPQPVPYSRPVREAKPKTGPLAALVELLDGTHLMAPERLPEIARAAAATMGVGLSLYVVDYDQRWLVPLGAEAESGGVPLGVDTTLAGRAFRLVQTLPSDLDQQPRLWMPLLDGAERLGVVALTLPDRTDLYDPVLREQCRWLAKMLGHLLASGSAYGDALHRARLTQPRSVAAEMLWALLPPLTTGTDRFVLAGILEPSYAVGGDAFDYAVSEGCVSLAIFDAMGHALGAGLIAATALAAYRSARRSGHGVFAQGQVIDEAIAAQFPDAFCTGVLAELDLASGRLRYVVAGHQPPLVLRDGKVVRSLTAGRRVPFGLDAGAGVSVGEENLQQRDWLVLYTDGVIEARDSQGTFFGEARLIDFLEREAAAGHPPPETVRRLTHAVLAHQNGELQDDATVVLASWNESGLTP